MQILSGKSSDLDPALETALAEYRHKIFIEQLGWPLAAQDGMERDQFDRPTTVYVVARGSDGAICGCARLLPTTEPYLLSEVFPVLLAGQPAPRACDVWELSRFAAATTAPGPGLNAAIDTRDMLAAAVASAIEQGATRLITVSPPGVERLLLKMGIHAHRAAPPLRIEGKPLLGCWIEIDEQTKDALGIASIQARLQTKPCRVYPAFGQPTLHTVEEEHF
jgi:acyl homoserine lactone synthase